MNQVGIWFVYKYEWSRMATTFVNESAFIR